jgi:hypothetical protein
MKKLKLDVERIQVESFEVSSSGNSGGTARGFMMDMPGFQDELMESENQQGSCWASCPTAGCGTCFKTCWESCAPETN